jgi:hypothetical protein
MVQHQAFRDGANKPLERHTMSAAHGLANLDLSISVPAVRPTPSPARVRLFNPIPKTLFDRSQGQATGLLKTLVVHMAQAATVVLAVTFVH